MAGYGYDAARGLLVIARGNDNDDDEYLEFLRRVGELDRDATGRKSDPVFVLVTAEDTPAPNAHWRRRIAEASADSACSIFAAVVTQSAVQRGVLNALRWLQSNPRGSAQAFPTFEAACSAAERHRGESLSIALGRLWQAARLDLAQRRGSGAPLPR